MCATAQGQQQSTMLAPFGRLPPRFAVSQKTAGKSNSNSNPAHGQHLAMLNTLICVLAFRLHTILVRGAQSAPIGGGTKRAP
jgi:hypothetical protein